MAIYDCVCFQLTVVDGEEEGDGDGDREGDDLSKEPKLPGPSSAIRLPNNRRVSEDRLRGRVSGMLKLLLLLSSPVVIGDHMLVGIVVVISGVIAIFVVPGVVVGGVIAIFVVPGVVVGGLIPIFVVPGVVLVGEEADIGLTSARTGQLLLLPSICGSSGEVIFALGNSSSSLPSAGGDDGS